MRTSWHEFPFDTLIRLYNKKCVYHQLTAAVYATNGGLRSSCICYEWGIKEQPNIPRMDDQGAAVYATNGYSRSSRICQEWGIEEQLYKQRMGDWGPAVYAMNGHRGAVVCHERGIEEQPYMSGMEDQGAALYATNGGLRSSFISHEWGIKKRYQN